MLELLAIVALVVGLVLLGGLVGGALKVLFQLIVWPFKALFWLLGALVQLILLPFQLAFGIVIALVLIPLILVGVPILFAVGVPLLVVGALVLGIWLVGAIVALGASLVFGG